MDPRLPERRPWHCQRSPKSSARAEWARSSDAEHALDPRYAKALGLDLDRLLISQPDNGEQALEIVETLVRSGVIDLVVVDSVAALVPRAEIEGEMGDAHVGLQARLMSQAMRKLTGLTAKTKASLIFINQTRHKIGVTFGSPETTTGGNALKFYCSVRVDIRRIGAVKDGEQVIGNRVRAKVVKNKLAPPFRDAEFEILYGQGVSTGGEILDMGIERGIVKKSGAWLALGDLKLGQGRERGRAFLEERPSLMSTLRELLLSEGDATTLAKELGDLSRWETPEEGEKPSDLPQKPETPARKSQPASDKKTNDKKGVGKAA